MTFDEWLKAPYHSRGVTNQEWLVKIVEKGDYPACKALIKEAFEKGLEVCQARDTDKKNIQEEKTGDKHNG